MKQIHWGTFSEKIKKWVRNPRIIFRWIKLFDKNVEGFLQCAFVKDKVYQKEKIRSFVQQDRFCLIILDACRYDYFEEEYQDYFQGTLEKVWASGRDTFEYVRKTYPGKYSFLYISGAVPINSVLEEPRVIHSQPPGLYGGYVPKRHLRILDVWNFGWSEGLGTVPPDSVVDAALKHREPRMVVHFFQPHFPAIGEPKILGGWGQEYGRGRGKPPDENIFERARKGKISKRKMRQAYRGNLRLVLKQTAKFLNFLDDTPVVVTADHGEFLGEEGLWSHPRIHHPVLFEVPWLEVKAGQ